MKETFTPSRISVIMACHNRATLVEEAMICVLNQTSPA